MIFGHNYFISEPIFKIFVALFRTYGLQKDGMVIFFLMCFRKVRFRKMQFLKDGVQTVVAGLPVSSGSLSVSSGNLPVSSGSLPASSGSLPASSGSLPVSSGSLPVSSGS